MIFYPCPEPCKVGVDCWAAIAPYSLPVGGDDCWMCGIVGANQTMIVTSMPFNQSAVVITVPTELASEMKVGEIMSKFLPPVG